MAHDPKKIKNRVDSVFDKLEKVQSPGGRVQAAYDHLRSAMRISTPEANAVVVGSLVPILNKAAHDLLTDQVQIPAKEGSS